MKWSAFNHILCSGKYGYFIYNSSSNSFVKISEELYRKFRSITDFSNENISTILSCCTEDLKNILYKCNIIVEDDFDNQFLLKKKYIRNMLSYSNSMVSLTVATTTACNFKCPYCFEDGIVPQTMQSDVEQAIVDYVLQFPNIHIAWYGGEPLLNFSSIVNINKKLETTDTYNSLTQEIITNGYLLTEDICNFFANKNLKQIQVTIDGREAAHNRSRIHKEGLPTYQTILSNIDTALKILPNTMFAIRVNVNMANREEYPLLYKELSERWKSYKNIKPYLSFVENYGLCDNRSLDSSEKINYVKELRELGIYETIYPKANHGICLANRCSDYVVAPDGSLYKCWADIGRKDKMVGNIKTPKNITNFQPITDYAFTYDKFHNDKCLSCFILPMCDGGCPHNRYEQMKINPLRPVCPYKLENIDSLLELVYENYLKVKSILKDRNTI